MTKNTKYLLNAFVLSLLIACAAVPSQALSKYQQKVYAQNNIIFYKPCGTDATVSAAESAAAAQITVYGETVTDKFYYGIKGMFSDQTKAQKYFAYILYISRFETNKRLNSYLTAFDVETEPSGVDFKNYTAYVVYGDDEVISNVGSSKTNEIIGYLLYNTKSDIESKTLPEGDASFDEALEEAKNYIPKPGGIDDARNWPTTVSVPETEPGSSEDSSTSSCANDLLSGILGGENPTGGTTTTATGSVSMGEFKVVDSSIPVSTYAQQLKSKGIYQGARNWKGSESRNGKYGWNDHCLQMAKAQANGLLHGTYPSTDVVHDPDQGSGWNVKENATLSEFLSIVFEKINSGHPVVIKVGLHRNKDLEKYYPSTEDKDTRHFVTVVGYKKTATSASDLTLNDLYILDSWGADLYNSSSSSSRVIRPNNQLKWQSGEGYWLSYQN